MCVRAQTGAANRAELREQVARQQREIELLKAKLAEGGVEDGDGGSRLEVLEVRGWNEMGWDGGIIQRKRSVL